MSHFVWCKKEDRRIPDYRCLLCADNCYPGKHSRGEVDHALEKLLKSGRYKERFVMRRKENIFPNSDPSAVESSIVENNEPKPEGLNDGESSGEQRVFLLEDGKLKPFATEEYTASALYQMVESFSVECRLVRPEDPGSLVFEGKRPAKRTLPIIITKSGETVLLESWESLEAKPEQLVDAHEVIGATPVKQVFVLKRK